MPPDPSRQPQEHTPPLSFSPLNSVRPRGVGVQDTLVLCAWGAVVVARSLRGRPSQVKGAFGVADAMALRTTLDLRASTAPCGQRCEQAQSPALHNARHHHSHPRTQHNHAQKQRKQQHPKTKTPD